MTDPIQAQKNQVRRRLRAARAQLAPAEISRRAVMLREALESRVSPETMVAGYMPLPGEPDVMPFLDYHAAHYGTVYLPMIPADGSRTLGWGSWHPVTQMRRHPVLPIWEPAEDHPASLADLVADAACLEIQVDDPWRSPFLVDRERPPAQLLVLLPALAIDTSGARMGQGGGFYDTTLGPLEDLVARHPGLRCEVIAVVHSGEVLPAGSFPVEEHDLRVRLAATEYRVFAL